MRIRCRPDWLLIVCFAAGSHLAAFAQSGVQPAWTRTTITQVKPLMRSQYEKDLKQEMAAYKKAGTPWLVTLQTFAGETTEYTTIVPVMKFADLDGPAVPVRVLGQHRWKVLSKRIARCYSSQRVEYATPLTALRMDENGHAIGSYWVETKSQPVTGKTEDYLNWLRNEYGPAMDKGGVVGFNASIAVFGSPGREIVTMRLLKHLAEIDQGSILTRALGRDQASAVSTQGAKLVRSTSTRILYVRKDLSY